MRPEQIFRAIGERVRSLRRSPEVRVEQPKDPIIVAALETRGRALLLQFYTNETSLTALGEAGPALSGLNRLGTDILQTQAEFGIPSNLVPTLASNLRVKMAKAASITVATREQLLSMVSPDRREVVESETLLQAREQLERKLHETDLGQAYRIGAQEMLRRIEGRLREITKTGEE